MSVRQLLSSLVRSGEANKQEPRQQEAGSEALSPQVAEPARTEEAVDETVGQSSDCERDATKPQIRNMWNFLEQMGLQNQVASLPTLIFEDVHAEMQIEKAESLLSRLWASKGASVAKALIRDAGRALTTKEASIARNNERPHRPKADQAVRELVRRNLNDEAVEPEAHPPQNESELQKLKHLCSEQQKAIEELKRQSSVASSRSTKTRESSETASKRTASSKASTTSRTSKREELQATTTKTVPDDPDMILSPNKWQPHWSSSELCLAITRVLELDNQLSGYTGDMMRTFLKIIAAFHSRNFTLIPSLCIDELFRIFLYEKGATKESIGAAMLKIKGHNLPSKYKEALKKLKTSNTKPAAKTSGGKSAQTTKRNGTFPQNKSDTHVPAALWKKMSPELQQEVKKIQENR